MNPAPSEEDRLFRAQVENCTLPEAEFDHRGHLRLAFVYSLECEAEAALVLMRSTLQRYLASLGADPAIYHETVTRAWMLAVQHFMRRSADCDSFEQFIANSGGLLETEIMLTHYSKERLFSREARAAFLPPDLSPITVG